MTPWNVVPSPSGRRLLLFTGGSATPGEQGWRVLDLDAGTLGSTPFADPVTFSPASDEVACGHGFGLARVRLSDGATTTLPGLSEGWPSALRWSEAGLAVASFLYPDLLFGDPTTGAVAVRTATRPHVEVGAWPEFTRDGGAVLYQESECLARPPDTWACTRSEDRLMLADLGSGEITTLASSAARLAAFAVSRDGAAAAYVYCSDSRCTLHLRATGR
jgi:hypothetical protein